MLKMKLLKPLAAISLATMLAASPAYADRDLKTRSAGTEKASFEADRADILAMVGDYKVRFDMKETTSWRNDYIPIKAKVSGGHESVRVIKDTGREIVLQHLLVVKTDDGPYVVKHWRQDWVYEPKAVLVYAGPNSWENKPVSEGFRKGRWSQTVWQVDDSPRYGGVGQWTTVGGVRRWRSNWTWRPLARRDAVRNPVYDRYLAINRHSPTPTGWIHWQDNKKMAEVDGDVVPYVQETVLNTYTKFNGYKVSAADDYWTKTRGFWEAIRAKWAEVIAEEDGLTIEEEASTGTVIAGKLLELADAVKDSKKTEAAATAEALELIVSATS